MLQARSNSSELFFCQEFLKQYNLKKIRSLYKSISKQSKKYKEEVNILTLENRKDLNNKMINDLKVFLDEVEISSEITRLNNGFSILELNLKEDSFSAGYNLASRVTRQQEVRKFFVYPDDLFNEKANGIYYRDFHEISLRPNVVMDLVINFHPYVVFHELRHAMFTKQRRTIPLNIFNKMSFSAKPGFQLDKFYSSGLVVEEIYTFVADIFHISKLFLKKSKPVYEKLFFQRKNQLQSITISIKRLLEESDQILKKLTHETVSASQNGTIVFQNPKMKMSFYDPGLVEDVRDIKVISDKREEVIKRIQERVGEHNKKLQELIDYIENHFHEMETHLKTTEDKVEILNPFKLFKLTSKLKRDAYRVGVLNVAFEDL